MEALFSSSLMRSAKQIPTILIYTDASFVRGYGASWGCYIRHNGKVVKSEKVIEIDVQNSTEAERVGVAAALWIADKKFGISGKRLIICCDNTAAVKPVKSSNKTGAKKQRARQQHEFYDKNILVHLNKADSIDIRYVKSHQDRSNRMKVRARHLVQDDCDKRARKVLTEYIKKTYPQSLKKDTK